MKPLDDSLIDFVGGAPVPGSLDVRWIHGSPSKRRDTDPKIQVHAYDEHTYILRQNMAVHYEAPFMFLLFGGSRALLLDTGATANPQFFPVRRTVDSIIDGITRSLSATASPHVGSAGQAIAQRRTLE